MARRQQTVSVAGRTLKLTSLDRVVYPDSGTTKAEVIEYLQRVAPTMLPHLRGRPVTRKRWPTGTGTADEPGATFFRKDLEDSAPAWVPRLGLQHSDHVNVYPIAEHAGVLAWFGQVSALELHVPQWRFDAAAFVPADDAGAVPTVEARNPDRLVLDLDPGPGTDLRDCARVARWCREILDDMGLATVPVTSGSKGIHLYAQLDGRTASEDASAVAKELARTLEADSPDRVTSRMKKTERDGKVFVDWSQNNASKTTVAPYSLRGRLRPWVAAPREWDELDDSELRHLEFGEVLARLADGIDPFAAFIADAGADRLERYRSMRDAAKTNEPVPSTVAERGAEEPIFVVQEHHARRLHFDTRLEHDGVLVSWAVPKGPPLEADEQRLAVQTEDHPIEYATFEGTIPAGQYGAGEVTIWDSGVVDIEKWQTGKIVFVLHGRPDGGLGGIPRRYALVRTGAEPDQWLIRLMKRQPARGIPAPMLATLGSAADVRGDDWYFEAKWDGYRMLAAVHEDGSVELRSRGGNDFTALYPELAELANVALPGIVADGEIVALNDDGRPDFGLLQRRSRPSSDRERQRGPQRIPVHLMLFDLLQDRDGRDVTQLPYARRRALLREQVADGRRVKVPGELGDDLSSALEVSAELGLEGIIAKRRDSIYRPGRRSPDWVKIKHAQHADVVIIGWREGQGSRASTFASLLLARREADGGLSYAGRVGSGFTDADLRELAGLLGRRRRKTPPVADVPAVDARDATWVTPNLEAEISHSGLTPDGRFRHAVWRRLQ